MGKKIMALSIALVMVLSFTACAGEDLPSAQEVVDGATQAMVDMRTCQFDMDMSLDIEGEADGESVDMNAEINSSGALDIENYQMQLDMSVNMAMLGEDDVDMAAEMYLIGDTMYMMTDIPGTGAAWTKSEIPGGTWEETAEQWGGGPSTYVELLELAEVKVTGSETVGGVDCYVIEVIPDMEKLWQLFRQQPAITMPDIDEELLDEIFQNYSVKQWIAKDTYLLAKAEIEMAMEFTPEALGSPDEEGELTTNVTLTMLAYDYDEPVSIELPPEAEEAVEMPMDF